MIPTEFFQIKVDKIVQELSFCVHASKNNHVLSHQHSSVAPSAFYRFLVAHLQHSTRPGLQIYQIDCVEADPAFATDVVGAHSSKGNYETVFVKDGGVITSGRWNIKLSDPGVCIEGVDLSSSEGSTAMASYHDGQVFV